ncbi:MAG: 2-hydroxyacid dehydrogenase [Victivallaceae bacterium]|nr:2-hydroxyacid dehydrogenase [Victivallaceae bacterium]
MSEKVRLALFDAKPYDRESFEEANRKFGFKLKFFEHRLEAATVSTAAGCDAVCPFVNGEIDADCVNGLVENGVKLIAMRCAGFNNVDLAAACGKLPVVRVPAYSPYAVAEYTMGLLLSLDRCIHRAYCRVRENNFSINGFRGFDLHGKTIGIVGTGKIGAVFAELFRGFGVKLVAYDLYPDQELAKELAIEYLPLNELFRRSDVISLHCPLTDKNRHMIDRKSIAKMKKGVIILNTSRGKLIDTKALIDGLKSGRIGGAGLDVYEEETGYFYEDRSLNAIEDDVLARLLSFPNVLVTSHQAFFTDEALGNIAETTLENVRTFFEYGKLPNSVCGDCRKFADKGRCVRAKKKKK